MSLDIEQPSFDGSAAERDDNHPPGPSVLRSWGPLIVGVVLVSIVVRMFLVQTYHIPTGSMIPTLVVGDRVMVNRLSYNAGDIQRGQVIVFSPPPLGDSENDLIKRVIGLPGETVRLVDNEVYIDGLRVVEPYLAEESSTRPLRFIPGCAQDNESADQCVIPQGFVFVMGDNRRGSSDSRAFGPVSIDTIVGRAFVRVWPIGEIGRL